MKSNTGLALTVACSARHRVLVDGGLGREISGQIMRLERSAASVLAASDAEVFCLKAVATWHAINQTGTLFCRLRLDAEKFAAPVRSNRLSIW